MHSCTPARRPHAHTHKLGRWWYEAYLKKIGGVVQQLKLAALLLIPIGLADHLQRNLRQQSAGVRSDSTQGDRGWWACAARQKP